MQEDGDGDGEQDEGNDVEGVAEGVEEDSRSQMLGEASLRKGLPCPSRGLFNQAVEEEAGGNEELEGEAAVRLNVNPLAKGRRRANEGARRKAVNPIARKAMGSSI